MKNDVRDASDLADLLRMGRLPQAWIAPPATRQLRELVRHRAELVSLRSHCKAEVRAVLATCGVQVVMSDLFGMAGHELRDDLALPAPYAARVASLRRMIEALEFEIDLFARMGHGRLAADPGYVAVQTIPGIGPVLGAVLVAEIGDITRFARPEQFTSGAGLTPKHHESDTQARRGRITKQGSRLVRWAVVESVQILPKTTGVGVIRERVGARRGRNIGVVAAARHQLEYVFYALRDHHVRALGTPRPRPRHEPCLARGVVLCGAVAQHLQQRPWERERKFRTKANVAAPSDGALLTSARPCLGIARGSTPRAPPRDPP